jgi:hypothetical protein
MVDVPAISLVTLAAVGPPNGSCYNAVVSIDNVNAIPGCTGAVITHAPGDVLSIKVTCTSEDYDAYGNPVGGGPVGAVCELYLDGTRQAVVLPDTTATYSWTSYDNVYWTVPVGEGAHSLQLVLVNIPCTDPVCGTAGCIQMC